MANKVTIEVEARFVDEVSGKTKYVVSGLDDIGEAADDAQKKLGNLGKKNTKASLDLDNNKFIKKLTESDNRAARFAGKTIKGTVTLHDKASSVLKKIEGGAKTIAGKTWTALVKIKDYATTPLKKIKDALFNIKSLVLAITAGLAANQFILKPINVADAYSSAKIGFSTLLGADRGQQMMDDLDEFAKKSPFDTSGVISNAQKMLAMGWSAEDIVGDMEIIGNAAASTGNLNQGLESIVRAMSQIKTKGKLSAEELNQLAEAGISAKAMLAEELGYGSGDDALAKFSKDQEKGLIGAEVALDALLRGMKRYDGMMESMANETAEGLMSQLKDTFEVNIVRRWGQGLQDGAKKGLGTVLDLLDESEGALQDLGDVVYDIGKDLSNWAADKLKGAVKAIKEITSTEEFQNAGLFDKVKMLWSGVIGNPFSEWWSNTVVPWWGGVAVPWLTEKATALGKAIGSGLTTGLLALFGIDVSDAVEDGSSIAGGFVQGFLDGFDGAAITDAFVDAIGNVWDALPTWAKWLIGGYGGAKVATGVGNLVGGISNIAGVVGSASAGTGILGFGSNAAIAMGAGNLAGGASLGAGALSALGLAGTAGLATGAFTAVDGGIELYKGIKNDDSVAKQSGGWKVGGALGGAAAGAAIGSIIPGVGTLVGAGVGALAGSALGWWQSHKIKKAAAENAESLEEMAKSESAAAEEAAKLKVEMDKLAKESLADHFGDITLSADEMQHAIRNVIGEEFFKGADAVTNAIDQMDSAFSSLQNNSEALKKNLWVATFAKDAKLTSDEAESLKSSAKSFRDSATAYVTDAQYAAVESVKAIMGNTEDAEKLIESTNKYYGSQGDEIAKLSKQLNDELAAALKDNVITVDEKKSLDEIRSSITRITQQIQQEEYEAEMNILKAKYAGDLTPEGFGDMMKGAAEQNEKLAETYWDGFGRASVGKAEAEIEILRQGVLDKLANMWSNTADYGLGTLKEQYAEELGIFGGDVANLLKEHTGNEITEAAEGMSEDTRAAVGKMMEYMQPTTEQIEGLVKSYKDAGLEVPEALSSYLETAEFYEALAKGPEAVEKYYQSQKIDIDPQIEMVDLTEKVARGLDPVEKVFSVQANVETEWTYDEFDDEWISPDGNYSFSTQALVEAGWTYNSFDKKWISPDEKYSFSTSAQIAAIYGVNQFNGSKNDFGVHDEYNYKTTVNVAANFKISGTMTDTGIKGTANKMARQLAQDGFVNSARGNIIYPSGFNAPGYAAGGMVRGGSRLVRVAEEGSPEMIIPLSSQRRERGLKLWEKAGEMLGAPGFSNNGKSNIVAPEFARGGIIGGSQDEGLRFNQYDTGEASTGQTVQIDVGGITVEIQVDATGKENIAEAIKEQGDEIAEVVAGILVGAFGSQFENTPTRGGIAY